MLYPVPNNRVRRSFQPYLHLIVQEEGSDVAYELSAARRFFIDRSVLERLRVSQAKLRGGYIVQIRRWLANRYTRAALPDAFNDRIRPAWNSPLRKTLKREGELLSGVFVAIDPWGEVDDDQNSLVALLGTMEVPDFADPEKREAASNALTACVNALADCGGIDIDDHELRSEDDVTLDDRRNYVRLDFDDLSVRQGHAATIAPD